MHNSLSNTNEDEHNHINLCQTERILQGLIENDRIQFNLTVEKKSRLDLLDRRERLLRRLGEI